MKHLSSLVILLITVYTIQNGNKCSSRCILRIYVCLKKNVWILISSRHLSSDKPTVGQEHRIFLHSQNSAQRFHWKFWHPWSANRGRKFNFQQLILRLKIAVSEIGKYQSSQSSLYTQFPIENVRPKVGNDFADVWLNLIWQGSFDTKIGESLYVFCKFYSKNIGI